MPSVFAGEPQPLLSEDVYLMEPEYEIFFEEDPYISDIVFEPVFDEDPGDPYQNDPDIVVDLEGALTQDLRAALNWTPYLEPDFAMYKVVHDQVDAKPYYPKHGYLDYFEDPYKTGYITGEVPEGDNYFRVCVLTTDDRRGCSNPVHLFVDPVYTFEPEFDPDAEPDPDMDMEPEPDPEREIDDEIRPDREVDRESTLDRDRPERLNNKPGFFEHLWSLTVNNLATIVAIITVLVAISGFTFATKRKQKSIAKYINQIDDTYSEYKMKAKRCEAELYRLKDIVDDQLKSGKIDEGAYQLLINRIEGYMIDVQKQIVNEKFGGLPSSMKDQMFKMMEDGEITESEFETMQTLIKRSELSASEQDSLLQTIKDFKKQDEMMKKKGRSE
ncbi:hypothetical protein GF369_02800 [Candidatus Peregrinibacteria bacterium]|nr:hypothetical protein [Candidatus Peregrinibacteria bacterium]